MLRASLPALVLVAAACGGGSSNSDGPPGGGDGPQVIDGPRLPDAATATCTPVSGSTVSTETLPGLNDALIDLPLLVTSPPGDRRLFIVQRSGEVQIYVDGAMLPEKFLDIRDNAGGPVTAGGEAGLLGLAFHPQYATNRKFYVYYTHDEGGWTDVVTEYQTSASDPNVADITTARVLLTIPDLASNHNGGMIEFGSDGFLYISDGDGGIQDDPFGNGQNKNSLLGKIMRIDVDTTSAGREYGIPPTNPYADGAAGAPEVFMYGLRNPWRWSFDRANGDIYIGDVGYGTVEEISVVPAATAPGTDLGWRPCEGTVGTGCGTPSGNRLPPVVEHNRTGPNASNFNAIIGGQVYRGSCYPDLAGRYFYSDNGAGGLWSFVYAGGVATDHVEHPGTFPNGPTSIHADAFGELYIGSSGGVFHIVAQ